MDDHLPKDRAYSVVHRDRWKFPGHPDEEIKMYEVDDLDDIPLPPDSVGISVLVYQADGTMTELTERERNETALDHVIEIVEELAMNESPEE